jgi:adenylylsulfate reductase subunit A
LETYRVGRNEIVAGTVSPSYILPINGLQRLEKIMDEYVGGIGAFYTTNEPLLTRGIELRPKWMGPRVLVSGQGQRV